MSILSWIARFINPFKSPVKSGRELQLSLDTASLYTLIAARQNSLQAPPPDPSQSQIAQLLGIPQLPPQQYQAVIVNRHLQSQARTLLHATHDSIISSDTTQNAVIQSVRFVPHIAPSTVPAAGRGLFIEGTAQPGDILALYPGVSYLPSQLRREQLLLGDYAISRYDAVIIDAAQPLAMDLSDILPESLDIGDKQIVHPFANAHLINHPPPGAQPNTLQFMIDFDLVTLPPPLRHLVPVENSMQPVSHLDRLENLAIRQALPGLSLRQRAIPENQIRRTIAIVALAQLADEELFFNYRFNPQLEAPDWYHDCDPQTSQRRWSERNGLL